MIEKAAFERLMNDARIALPGASDSGIKQELYNVLDEFCEFSAAWRETLTVPILAGTTTGNVNTNCNYTLTPQEDGTIIGLVGVWDPNNIPQPAFLPNGSGGGDSVGQLVLVNPVNTNQNFTVTVIKTIKEPPTRDLIPVFSQFLFNRYRRYITDGVIGRLQQQPNKPYSSDTKAAANYMRFRNGVNVARLETERQNTRGAQAWSYPRNFRVSSQRGGVSVYNPQSF